MRAILNLLYLIVAYSFLAASAYFAFYVDNFTWSRFIAYLLGAIAATMIFNGDKLVVDDYKDTRISLFASRASLLMLTAGILSALFGLLIVDIDLFGFVKISQIGWCAVFLSLLIGAFGKFLRELRKV